MKRKSNAILGILAALLTAALLLASVGCSLSGSFDEVTPEVQTAPAGMEFCFDEEFNEQSGLTDIQMLDLLIEYIGRLPGDLYFTTDENGLPDEMFLSLPEGIGAEEWVAVGETELQKLCDQFASLGEGCSIELSEDCATADIICGEGVPAEEADGYIAMLKVWCAYLNTLAPERFSPLEQVNCSAAAA